MWARAALAALIEIVLLVLVFPRESKGTLPGCFVNGARGGGKLAPIKRGAKLGIVVSPEHIPVSDEAEDDKTLGPSLEMVEEFGSYGSSQLSFERKRGVGPYALCRNSITRMAWIVPLRERIVGKVHSHEVYDAGRRRMPMVFNDDCNIERRRAVKIHRRRCEGEIRPQFSFERSREQRLQHPARLARELVAAKAPRSATAICLSPASHSLLVARYSVHSKTSDADRSDGRNGRGGLVEEFSDLPERDQGYVISGAVFVVGLAALITIFGVVLV